MNESKILNQRKKELQQELDLLNNQLKGLELLEEVWLYTGPYSNEISNEIRYKLQDYFGFDDSE